MLNVQITHSCYTITGHENSSSARGSVLSIFENGMEIFCVGMLSVVSWKFRIAGLTFLCHHDDERLLKTDKAVLLHFPVNYTWYQIDLTEWVTEQNQVGRQQSDVSILIWCKITWLDFRICRQILTTLETTYFHNYSSSPSLIARLAFVVVVSCNLVHKFAGIRVRLTLR